MELEKGRISSSQLVFLVISYMLGVALIIPPGSPIKQDAWLAIIFGLIEGIILTLIYLFLVDRFPGRTLVQINNIVYGPYLGKVISFIYISYFFHISSLIVIDFSNFFSGIIMLGTPFYVFVVLITLISASAVRNGVEAIARCSQVLLPFVFISIMLTFILLFREYNFNNFKPVFETPLKKMVLVSQRVAFFPFASVFFMMILPSVNKQGEIKKSFIKALIVSAFLLILVAVRNIGVLGGTGQLYTYPSFQAVRLIDYGQILTRLEVLVALNFLASGFLQFSLIYYGTVLGTAQLFNLRSYLPLVLPVGILITFQLHYYNIAETIEYQGAYPFLAMIFELVIPLLTLMTTVIRKLPEGEK